MIGRVHSIQTLGAVDGPGVRSVLFLQGCTLRCPYCHNPDTWDFLGGSDMQAQQAAKRLLRYRPYWGGSKTRCAERGGVTISGGEPLLQAAFTAEVFTLLKQQCVHTALDTSGCVYNEDVQRLLGVTDLVLLDIKMNTPHEYQEHIGLNMALPLAFLGELERLGIPTWLRQVVVGGIHDAPGQMEALRALAQSHACVKKVELLPFRKLCLEKYRALGLAFPWEYRDEPAEEMLAELKNRVEI